MNRNVANIPLRDLCCSCGACTGVCSQGAISLVLKRGLFIPTINETTCVGCGLCVSVCPSTPREIQSIYGEPDLFNLVEDKECYIAYSKNDQFRHSGTSGGFVTTVVFELLKKGLYEKAYVLDFERFDGTPAQIKPIDQPDLVVKSAKSKYIPASISEVVKDIINGTIGKSIIVATPCQLLAIKNTFTLWNRKEDDVLFIGLFCDKTLNYNIYGYYREKFGDFDSFHFRDKDGNDWPGDTVLYYNGKKTVIDKRIRMSLKPYFQLNRCRFCFDKLNQLADISCGDCYIKEEESTLGKSSLIIRTKKGSEVLKECSSVLDLKKSCFKDIKNSQGLKNKVENYQRNSVSDSPFILSGKMANIIDGTLLSKGFYQLQLGESANDIKGYQRIDKHINMGSAKPTNGKANRYFRRVLKLFYNPDPSVKILIDNAGFINKGAELMLQSVVQQLETLTQKVRIVVPRNVFYENLDYCHRHNILPLTTECRKNKLRIKRFLYNNLMSQPSLITPDQIDIVLDAGGFQFSDQWLISERQLMKKKMYYSSFTKANKKIIFLPQAFGPFEQSMSEKLIRTVFDTADLLYARELESYNHLNSLFSENSKIKLAPDFTCLSRDNGPMSVGLPKDYVILIPNVRMTTHTTRDIADHYFSFLFEVAEFLIRKGEYLVLLNHEGDSDLKLLVRLSNSLSKKVLLLNGLDALEVKRIIGEAKLLISSRYHGVVSGLTQGVPTLCTSWSHKYSELLKEYGCEKGLLSISDLNHAKQTIEDALENPSLYASKERFVSEVKRRSEEMWDEIWGMTKLK